MSALAAVPLQPVDLDEYHLERFGALSAVESAAELLGVRPDQVDARLRDELRGRPWIADDSEREAARLLGRARLAALVAVVDR